ncbi:Imm1 family immunity protein [Streptomyces sp. DH18]|uniref:Imm1 family immunity protein n=1 Tax=unclassified Streptomyces TaxID=2593676 RepID=UPI001E503BE1|nr:MULTISPECIES: Imm1 family immunity protein [unclassified Streptomyces]MDG9687903.1 Imm1 family immunity protein [Streptomyces sp. DH18]
MIVEFWIGGIKNLAYNQYEAREAIQRTLNELESERTVHLGFHAGTIASFHVHNVPLGAGLPEFADNALTVGINKDSGFGGMTWWGEQIPEYPDQAHWISRNRNPPDCDPRVTADPGYPLWFDRRNVLPVGKVALAIEEFCFNDGRRPTSTEWEPGTVNGGRLDSPNFRD